MTCFLTWTEKKDGKICRPYVIFDNDNDAASYYRDYHKNKGDKIVMNPHVVDSDGLREILSKSIKLTP